MSADNFTICPKCKQNGTLKQESGRFETNLAEWEVIGIDTSGKFVVEYRASCDKCGFKFAYNHEVDTLKETVK